MIILNSSDTGNMHLRSIITTFRSETTIHCMSQILYKSVFTALLESVALLLLRSRRKEGIAMDALELLKQDHAKVKELLETAESAQGKERTAIFEKIKNELETHARIEENVFYPAVQKNEGSLPMSARSSS